MTTATAVASGYHANTWRVTALSMLAGVGLGCLIGIFTSKWLTRGRGGRTSPQHRGSRRHSERESQANATSNLVAALANLTAEVAALQASLTHILTAGRHSQRRPRPPTEAGSVTSEFVSARLGSSDDEFYDME